MIVNEIIDNQFNEKSNREFSVTEISSRIKILLESNLASVRIRGEISGLKIASSGHGYFSLKDTNSLIAATCWRHALGRIKFELTEGLEVVVTGKITAYAGQSKYQISVELIEPAGVGAFMQILDERRKKFEQEGLFSPQHKKPLPYLPRKIGIVTSLTGAVIKDIIHRISDRFPVNLVIWPVTVQGETAANEVASAINGFNNLAPEQKPDLLIVARGGGSIEDLWAFNEEVVIRAAFNSAIPLISAIGHETDYTLLDFVADKRAPTPTAAAEFSVPVASSIRYSVTFMLNNITQKINRFFTHNGQILQNYQRILNYPANYLNQKIQKIDDLSFRLTGSLPNLLRQKNAALNYFPINRLMPTKLQNYKALQLTNSGNNLMTRKDGLLKSFTHNLSINSALLESLDYHKVLLRGYAILKDKQNNYICTTAQLNVTDKIIVKLQDGETVIENKRQTYEKTN